MEFTSMVRRSFISISCLLLLYSAAAGNRMDFSETGFNEPGWPLEVITWNLDKAHPGVLYDFRLGVIGGTYPYNFQIIEAPSGMTINERTGAVLWNAPETPSATNPVSVKIVDNKGSTLFHNWNIEVTANGFHFIDSRNGDDENAGTIEAPYQSFDKAYADLSKGDIIYLREGNYRTDTGYSDYRGESFPRVIWIDDTNPNIWMGYPGERIIFDGQHGDTLAAYDQNTKQFILADREENARYLFQNIEFINCGYYAFHVYAIKGVIIRNNLFTNQSTKDSENPAYIYSGSTGREIDDLPRERIIIQDNEMRNSKSVGARGAAVVLYDAAKVLFEDNYVHNIEGNGINDKQRGYYNTIRNNVIHDVVAGINLLNQYAQENIDVSHNLIYNTSGVAIAVGYQPGYFKNVFVHHNTIIGPVWIRWVLAQEGSDNYNLYHNIIVYNVDAALIMENNAVLDSGYTKLKSDNNLFYSHFNSHEAVARVSGHPPRYSLSQWQEMGFDNYSIFEDPQLDENYDLPETSPHFGIYGRNIKYDQSVGLDGHATSGYPDNYLLHQNYPNPFNPSTTISYTLSDGGNVSLIVYDILGREVIRLINETKPAGAHTVHWNGTNERGEQVGSGIYFYRLKNDGVYVKTKRMLKLK